MLNEWRQVRLGDYISIKSGLAYKGERIGSGDALLLGMGCVSYDSKFVESGARPYDDKGVDPDFYIMPGDIVLATRQQSDNNPILAMPAIVPDSLNSDKIIFGTNLYKVQNDSEISNRFLFWLLKHKHYVNYIAGVKSGTAVQMVTKRNVENYKFLCPPMTEREHIADVLWTYDEALDNNNRRIKVLEQMAENLYKEWFVRFRFPGHETAEFENGLPKGWEYRKLNTLLDVRYGKDHKSLDDGSIPVFGSGGIMRFGNKALYNGEAVLIPRKGSLNNIMYYNGPFWTVDTMFYSVPTMDHFAKYAYYTMASIDMESYNSGAALPSMTTDILYHFRLLVPDKQTLEKFDEFVLDVFKQKETLKKANEKLTAQRDLLLPRLMSGKLEV